MAEATIAAGPYRVGATKRVMREVLDSGTTGERWWDALYRAPKGAWAYVQQLAKSDLAARAVGFAKARISWFREFLAEIGLGRVAAYAATTIEGRRGIRSVLGFAWKVVAFPFKLIGKPIGWVLRHTGRPGKWVQGNTIIVFCWTRDKVVNTYTAAETWLEAHDDDWWMRWARHWLHWAIVSRIVDRLAPRWMPRWARFIVKAMIPEFTHRTKAGTSNDNAAADMAGRMGDSLVDWGLEVADRFDVDLGVAAEADAGLRRTSLRTRVPLRDTSTGRTVRADILTNGDEVFVKVEGSNQFVAGGIPTGYEEATLAEVVTDTPETAHAEPDVPLPASREARRFADREATRAEAKAHGPKPGPKPGPTPPDAGK